MAMKGPQFLTFIRPLIDVLKNGGGSGTTGETIDKVIDHLGISDDEVAITISSGASRIRNQIQWARMYLVKADFMDASQRGVWKLTKKGMESNLDDDAVYALFKKIQVLFGGKKKSSPSPPGEVQSEDDPEEITVEDEAHGDVLLSILKSLSPAGFEKLCKRLLTEIGIHDVQVTGQSRDQGIDGTGVIKINDVVGFNIIFQCKRYKDSVAPHYVRDFRGTMQGRADKGLYDHDWAVHQGGKAGSGQRQCSHD